jgi:hypothetical protein
VTIRMFGVSHVRRGMCRGSLYSLESFQSQAFVVPDGDVIEEAMVPVSASCRLTQ